MSKGILVFDDLKDNCYECQFMSVSPRVNEIYCCGIVCALEDKIRCVDGHEDYRPDWCPLKPMPEKK